MAICEVDPDFHEVKFGDGSSARELDLRHVSDHMWQFIWADEDDDPVNHPSHYNWLPNGFEVIDMTEHMTFCLGNVVKYVARAGRKTDDPTEDLKKAEFYLRREIERLEARSE